MEVISDELNENGSPPLYSSPLASTSPRIPSRVMPYLLPPPVGMLAIFYGIYQAFIVPVTPFARIASAIPLNASINVSFILVPPNQSWAFNAADIWSLT